MWGNLERWQSWSIVPDLKSGVLQGTVGSNPTPSAKINCSVLENDLYVCKSGRQALLSRG